MRFQMCAATTPQVVEDHEFICWLAALLRCQQPINQMASNESGSAGNQHSHCLAFPALCLSGCCFEDFQEPPTIFFGVVICLDQASAQLAHLQALLWMVDQPVERLAQLFHIARI